MRSSARLPVRSAAAVLISVQLVLIAAITVLTIGLPDIARDLRLASSELALLNAAYGLSFSGLLLLGGRIVDLAGTRQVFVAGVAVFAVASVLTGLAASYPMLLAARFGQGCGAAFAAPAAMTLYTGLFAAGARRSRAVAVWGGVASIGATSGVVISGLVRTLGSWQWFGAVPALVAALALAASPWLPTAGARQPAPTVPTGLAPVSAKRQLDLAGATLITICISLLSFGAARSGDHPFLSWSVAGVLAAGLTAGTAAVAVERRTPTPLLPPGVFTAAARIAALSAITLTSASLAAMFYFLTLHLRQAAGYSPLATGCAFLPVGVALAATGPLAHRLLLRLGARRTTALGLLVNAAGLLLLARFGPYPESTLAGLVLAAAGARTTFSAATVLAVDDVPRGLAGLAAGVVNTALEIGPAIGFAALAAVATARSGTDPTPGAITSGYTLALTTAGLLLIGTAGGLAALSPSTGLRRPRSATAGAADLLPHRTEGEPDVHDAQRPAG